VQLHNRGQAPHILNVSNNGGQQFTSHSSHFTPNFHFPAPLGMKQVSNVQRITLMANLCGNHKTYSANLKIPLIHFLFIAFVVQ